MKIPVYEQQVNKATPNIIVPQLATKPQEAFGANVHAAQAQLGQQIEKIGGVMSKYVIEKQKEADEKAVIATDTSFRKDMQDILYNKELNEKEIPKGLLLRNLSQAKNITPELDTKYEALRNQYMGNMVSDAQKEALAKSMDSHYYASRNSVITHEANEDMLDYKQTFDSNIKQMTLDSASYHTPNELNGAIVMAQAKQAEGLKRLGTSPETIKFQNEALGSAMLKGSIENIIDKDWKTSQHLLNEAAKKGIVPKDTIQDIQLQIDGKAFDDKRYMEFQKLNNRTYLYSDGSPNLSKINASVMSLKGYTMEEKNNILGFVHSKFAEKEQEQIHLSNIKLLNFKDAAAKQKIAGQPLENALKVAGQFATGPSDLLAKEKYIKDMYSSAVDTNPSMYIGMSEKIKSGKGSVGQIDKLYLDGYVNSSDWSMLRKTFFDVQTKGKSEEMDMADTQADLIFKQKYKDKTEIDKAKLALERKSDEMELSPQQKVKMANDMTKEVTVPGSGWVLPKWVPFGYGGKKVWEKKEPQYKELVKQYETEDTKIAEWEDVEGTPEYNAIKSLRNANQPVSVEAIRRILTSKSYQNGIVPPEAFTYE